MEDVQFEEVEDIKRPDTSVKKSGITQFVIRMRLAKNERQAQAVLLVSAIVIFAIAYMIFIR